MAEITSLSLLAGAPTHVTVVDHNNADAGLPPSSVTWSVTGGPFQMTWIVADATGFNITAASPGSYSIAATYSSGGVHVQGPILTLTVTAAVQPAYTSP